MDNNEVNSLEIAYQSACDFQKSFYEEISENENKEITYQINKEKFSEIENPNTVNAQLFQMIHFTSSQDLYNSRFKSDFEHNFKTHDLEIIQKEVGEDNLLELAKNDIVLRNILLEKTKELDLDNDGIPDRIDINDSDNSLQTVSDLNIVGNSANKQIAENKNIKIKRSNDEMEL